MSSNEKFNAPVEQWAGLRAHPDMACFSTPSVAPREPARRPRAATCGWLMVLPAGLALCTVPAQANAASESTAPAAASAEPAPVVAPAEQAPPLLVTVETTGYELPPLSVQIAIGRELGVAVTDAGGAAATRVTVKATKGGDLVVIYQAPGSAPLMRAVAAPGRDDEVAEAAALLAGNLARDEAAALLAATKANAAAPSKEPPAEAEPAKAKPAEAQEPAPKPHRRPLVNLSLFHPLTIIPQAEQQHFLVELGLFYSRVGGVDALALNPLVLRVHEASDGFQLAGVASFNHGSGRGFHSAGVLALHQGAFRGVAVDGVVRVAKGSQAGAQVAGVLAYQTDSVDGFAVAGVVNVVGRDLKGFAVAGALSTVSGNVEGAQTSVLNVAGSVEGAQIGVVNVASQSSGSQSSGMQLGLVNIGGAVEGLQLGLVNVAESVDGASIGFVTYSEQGRTQPVVWFSTATAANVGLRFYTGPLYAMPTLGFSSAVPAGEEGQAGAREVATITPGISLGARIPVRRAFVDIDANYGNPAPEFRYDEHQIELTYRALVGFELTSWFAVFAGGGVRDSFHTVGPTNRQLDPELSLGVQFL